MVWVSWSELRRREAAVLDACVEQMLTRPMREVTIKAVAEASSLPTWAAYGAIRRVARNREHLMRRAILNVAYGFGRRFEEAGGAATGVLATIEAFIGDVAAIIRGEDFASLFRVVLCEGPFHPWLHDIYEEKVAGAFCRRLEALVDEASRGTSVAVRFPAGAARNALRRLESEFLLAGLLPGDTGGGGGGGGSDDATLLRNVAVDTFGRTYAWDLGEAA